MFALSALFMPHINPLYVFLAGLATLLILLNDGLRRIVTILVLIVVVIAGVLVFAPSAVFGG